MSNHIFMPGLQYRLSDGSIIQITANNYGSIYYYYHHPIQGWAKSNGQYKVYNADSKVLLNHMEGGGWIRADEVKSQLNEALNDLKG